MSRARDFANLAGTNSEDLINQGRNLIINGAMQVAQRGTSFTSVTASAYHLDRFKTYVSNDGVLTVSQSTDAPDGFSNSYKLEVTTADTSIGSTQYAQVGYKIEAQDVQSLSYGTSSAKTVTLSFWVKSSKTGTYCICYSKDDTTRYDYVSEYTINSANTWEQKEITIVPDSNIQASGGAIQNDNGTGIFLKFVLAAGSGRQGTNNTWNSTTPADATSNQVNWLDSTSNDFYLTGVQLEVGSQATPFEHRSFAEEMLRCQRYFCGLSSTGTTPVVEGGYIYGYTWENNNVAGSEYYSPVDMRAQPTLSYTASYPSTWDSTYYRINGVRKNKNSHTSGSWFNYPQLDAEL